jgi:hypothetical protein
MGANKTNHPVRPSIEMALSQLIVGQIRVREAVRMSSGLAPPTIPQPAFVPGFALLCKFLFFLV